MDSLPGWASSILLNAAKLTGFNMTVESQHESAANWESMLTEFPNIEVRDFPEDVINALRESNASLLEEEVARSELTKKIVDSQAAYLKRARAWTSIGDQAFLNNIAK